jgi:lysophospholipase L1-like esterase
MLRFRNLVLLTAVLLTACNTKTEKQTIVVLGDSNGAHEHGWVYHLQQRMRPDTLLNFSISGNTIGYDNLGRTKLNTLKNVTHVLSSADSSMKNIDEVLILLGTNDCKAVFQDSMGKTVENLETLINKINTFNYSNHKVPKIVIISPPPYGTKSETIEKYIGGDSCVVELIPQFKEVAAKYQIDFIDIYEPLKPEFDSITVDGVHLTQEGYSKMAGIIFEHLKGQK